MCMYPCIGYYYETKIILIKKNYVVYEQLVLDDSEMIRYNLRAFRSVLAEISAVCDISAQEQRLEHNDQQVLKMQRSVLEPLEQLLQAVAVRMLKLEAFGRD